MARRRPPAPARPVPAVPALVVPAVPVLVMAAPVQARVPVDPDPVSADPEARATVAARRPLKSMLCSA